MLNLDRVDLVGEGTRPLPPTGGVAVAQRMQVRVDAEISGHLRAAVADAVRVTVPPVVGGVGEHEGVVVESGAEFGAAALRALLVVGQD